MKEEFEGSFSESGNWNVANSFAYMKISKWLIFFDMYEEIAKFGTDNIMNEFILDENTKNKARIIALRRLFHATGKIIGNTFFAMYKNGKALLEEAKGDLEILERILPMIEEKYYNQQKKRTETFIKEKEFNFLLKNLRNIHDKILEPLNKSDLIFMGSKEHLDPFEIKELYKQKMINFG